VENATISHLHKLKNLMKLTLLIDLDDTLLANNMERFERAYLKALSTHLSNLIKPEIMLRELINATQCMIRNDRPDLTLEVVFDNAFYPAIGVSKTELMGVIASFYAEVFPNLIAVTSSKPDAQYFVNWAVSKGHSLIIATNPLFPRTAIYQRLAWAGFPPEQYPFQLISSYESFHFSKPNLAYYAEILARLGWPHEPVIMIGNDYRDDILPAKKLGLTTFWVNRPNSSSSNEEMDREQKSGDLYDLVTWLDTSVDIPIFHISDTQDALVAASSANRATLQKETPL
jgi:FMN phosphatase YigB (HAD superfamily)